MFRDPSSPAMQLKSLLCFSPRQIQRHIVAFNMLNYRSCKNLWKSCVEHHTFFQAKKLLPQEKNVLSQCWSLGSRNPKKVSILWRQSHTSLKCKPDLVTPREQTSPGKRCLSPEAPRPGAKAAGDIRASDESLFKDDSDVSFMSFRYFYSCCLLLPPQLLYYSRLPALTVATTPP